ncbi:MAG TPA: NADPH-dependent F420 reductase [Gaiellaceae bacterium]|jgi:NADPH-dependent F420 reductase
MTVAILGGTGDLGYGLAVRLAHAGITVAIGSRDAARAADAAARVGGGATGAENAVAARDAEIVIVTVPFAAQVATLSGVVDALDGQVVVEATVPLATAIGGKPTRTVGVWAGSAAQQAQEIVGDKARVVSALHTVSAASLADLDHVLDEDVLLCGDKKADKDAVAALIEQIKGLRCIDAGRLELSRIVEQLTPLLISINIRHKTHAGIRITGV